MKILAIVLALAATPAPAADLTLNDLPTVLRAMRGCSDFHGFLPGCIFSSDDIWAAVKSDEVILFYNRRAVGLDITAHGATVGEAVSELAAKLKAAGVSTGVAIESLAPFLPSQ